MYKASQRGFTLIELVVVIVILGILAAFAVPRFMGLEAQARVASLKSLQGALRSSAAMAHSLYLANGTNPSSLTVEGQNIAFFNGYPDPATIVNTLSPGLTGPGGQYTLQQNAGNTVFIMNGATNQAQCRVTYTRSAGQNLPPTVVVPNNGQPNCS